MVDGRWRLIGTILQPSDQFPEPLLQMHPVHKAILFSSELTQLIGVFQVGRLKLLEQSLAFLQLLLKTLRLRPGLLQNPEGFTPQQPLTTHLIQAGLQLCSSQAIQPTALLPWSRQLLGLALHREVNQQGAKGQHLLTIHRHTIDTKTTGEALVLTAPFTAHHQLLVLTVTVFKRQLLIL